MRPSRKAEVGIRDLVRRRPAFDEDDAAFEKVPRKGAPDAALTEKELEASLVTWCRNIHEILDFEIDEKGLSDFIAGYAFEFVQKELFFVTNKSGVESRSKPSMKSPRTGEVFAVNAKVWVDADSEVRDAEGNYLLQLLDPYHALTGRWICRESSSSILMVAVKEQKCRNGHKLVPQFSAPKFGDYGGRDVFECDRCSTDQRFSKGAYHCPNGCQFDVCVVNCTEPGPPPPPAPPRSRPRPFGFGVLD